MDSPTSLQSPPSSTEPPRRSRWPKIIGLTSAGLVLLVLAAILIPCLMNGMIAADESSAIGSLRAIATSQIHFSEEHLERGFAKSLVELRPSVVDGQIDLALTSGTKNGYVFTLTPGAPDASGVIKKYTVTASPQTFGKAGVRSFFVDETGIIRYTAENRRASASDPPLQ